MKTTVALIVALLGVPGGHLSAANLLVNGDFNAPPVLGPGQSDVEVGKSKMVSTKPANADYSSGISGIRGWTSALPLNGGTASDHGVARPTAFGDASGPRMVFINNWGRVMSQKVVTPLAVGSTVTAQIQFGTLGTDSDGGRAGTFYLVAGEADSSNLDVFSSRSIILEKHLVGNRTFRGTLNTKVANRVLTTLTLSHTFAAEDPALNLPLTVAFRTEQFSVGLTYWENASLTVEPPRSTAISSHSDNQNGGSRNDSPNVQAPSSVAKEIRTAQTTKAQAKQLADMVANLRNPVGAV